MHRMRTLILSLAGLLALAFCGVAAAATLNTYTGSVTAKQSGPGTARKPVAFGMVLKLGAAPATPGQPNADPLTDIKLTLPGVTFDDSGFPVCSAASITTDGNDASCPHKALVATGPVTAALWSPATPTVSGAPCDPVLDVWNAGKGKLTYFFKIPAGHQCAGLQTGAVAPWTGTLKEQGGALIDDTPLPPPVSTDAGNLGLYSSLETESLTFSKLTETVKHKTVPFFASTGCKAGKRPYTIAFTATDGSTSQTSTVTGAGGC